MEQYKHNSLDKKTPVKHKIQVRRNGSKSTQEDEIRPVNHKILFFFSWQLILPPQYTKTTFLC